jgi:N-formylmaleamate deformylase
MVIHEERIPVTGGHLACRRTGGDRPALVLSHGLTDNGLCWGRLAEALAPDFDVIMLDARGHGGSSRLAGAPPDYAGRDIAEAIDFLGLRSPIVMGHSMGARATVEFAASHPGRAAKVILEDPPFLPLADAAAAEIRRRKFRDQVVSLQAMSDAELFALGRKTSPDWHEDEFPAWVASKRQVDPDAMPDYRAPWQDSLRAISAPILLILGEPARGALVTAEIADEAMALNPGITAVRIANAGHNIRRENFTGYLAAVRTFLARG